MTTTTVPPPPSGRRFPLVTLVVIGVLSPVAYIYATDTRASLLHQYIVPPLLRLLFPDAEAAHHVGTDALKALYSFGLHPRERLFSGYSNNPNSSPLGLNVFGARLASPLAISAGLDKDAEIPDALFALGASVVEVGGCTLLPQDGNPKPRVFRIPSVDGLINRYGLNSRGADAMASRLRDRRRRLLRSQGLTEQDLEERTDLPPGSLLPGRLLLVQMAKNKETDERDLDAVKRDYVGCVQRLAPYADVLVVNVSSPNTPGLRDLQATGPLTDLLTAVVDEAQRTQRKQKPRVMVKVSPDEEDDSQIEGVVQAVWMSGVDGVIVGNTTKRRDVVPAGVKLRSKEVSALREVGGFSGPAMFGRTLSLVGRYRKMLDSYSLKGSGGEDAPTTQKVIFATGGITTGEQALQALNAGASVAMVYTGIVYGGSGTITRMKQEMIKALEKSQKTA
jgi:dihydroorotate dehydrogenase